MNQRDGDKSLRQVNDASTETKDWSARKMLEVGLRVADSVDRRPWNEYINLTIPQAREAFAALSHVATTAPLPEAHGLGDATALATLRANSSSPSNVAPSEPMCECDVLSKHPLNSNDLRAWQSLAYDLEARLEKACDAYGEAHGRAAEMAESIRAESAPSSTRPIAEVSIPLAEVINTPCPFCGKKPIEGMA